MLIKRLVLPALLSLMFFAVPVAAEQSQTFGDYTVHYIALPTEILDPAVAGSYKILRSKNRAFLNISVLKNNMGTATHPVKAKVTATGANLSAQLRELDMRELEDGGAIYYIGEIPIVHEETINFKVQITPEGTDETFDISFQQQFFTK